MRGIEWPFDGHTRIKALDRWIRVRNQKRTPQRRLKGPQKAGRPQERGIAAITALEVRLSSRSSVLDRLHGFRTKTFEQYSPKVLLCFSGRLQRSRSAGRSSSCRVLANNLLDSSVRSGNAGKPLQTPRAISTSLRSVESLNHVRRALHTFDVCSFDVP